MAILVMIFYALVVTASDALIESEPISSSDHLALLQLISQEQSLRLQLEAQLHKLQGQFEALQSQLTNSTVVVSKNKQQVAFSGKLQHRFLFSNRSIIKFDDVITNIGNAYSQTTGIFHCPISGLYLFSLNILTDTAGNLSVDIVQNGKRIARPYTISAASTGEHASASDTVVVHAKIGDEIYVNHMDGHSVYLDNMSLFTGVLLKAD